LEKEGGAKKQLDDADEKQKIAFSAGHLVLLRK
jgi:hypothetical protein